MSAKKIVPQILLEIKLVFICSSTMGALHTPQIHYAIDYSNTVDSCWFHNWDILPLKFLPSVR